MNVGLKGKWEQDKRRKRPKRNHPLLRELRAAVEEGRMWEGEDGYTATANSSFKSEYTRVLWKDLMNLLYGD